MPNPPTKKTPTLVPKEQPNNIEDLIRLRAYDLYEARGKEDGHDVEDWLRAEAEVGSATEKAAA